MDKKLFDEMITNIITLCKEMKVTISKVDNISIKDLKQVKTKNILKTIREDLSSFQSKSDKILKLELYHILNMGNMSAGQTMTFLKHIKEVGILEDKIKRCQTVCDAFRSANTAFTGQSSYSCSEIINSVFINNK